MNVWFQKISTPPPRWELEILEEWEGVKGPGNSGEEGVVSEITFPDGQVQCCDDLVEKSLLTYFAGILHRINK